MEGELYRNVHTGETRKVDHLEHVGKAIIIVLEGGDKWGQKVFHENWELMG
jgi:hypothetical protein